MRRKLVPVLACLAAASAAHGQSGSVTIYGVMDAALTTSTTGSGTTTPGGTVATPAAVRQKRLDSSVGPGSRLGFRGREDLGDGLAAVFTLEGGIGVDNGTFQQGGLPFGRQAFVGLTGKNWTLTAGRQYSAMTYSFAVVSGLSGFYWGNIVAVSGFANYASLGSQAGGGSFGQMSRIDNSVKGTMTWGPVTGTLIVGAGQEGVRSKTGRMAGVGLAYDSGPLSVHAVYNTTHTPQEMLATATTPIEMEREWLLGAAYDFGVIRVAGGVYEFTGMQNHANQSNVATPGAPGASPFAYNWDKTRAIFIGARVPAGPTGFVSFDLSRIRYDYRTIANGNSTVFGIAYEYYLSKRSKLYVSYGMVQNDERSRTPLLAAVTPLSPATNGFGSDPKALSIGMSHSF